MTGSKLVWIGGMLYAGSIPEVGTNCSSKDRTKLLEA